MEALDDIKLLNHTHYTAAPSLESKVDTTQRDLQRSVAVNSTLLENIYIPQIRAIHLRQRHFFPTAAVTDKVSDHINNYLA